MFPVYLKTLFPSVCGDSVERDFVVNGRNLKIVISRVSPLMYDLIIIDRDTAAEYLRCTRVPKDVIEFNWKSFRRQGFRDKSK